MVEDDRNDSNGEFGYRVHCLHCGTTLTGLQRTFCSDECRMKHNKLARAEYMRNYRHKKVVDFRATVKRVHQCEYCVWKNPYGICNMPSCFKNKGIDSSTY